MAAVGAALSIVLSIILTICIRVDARDVIVFTQTNISSEFLLDPTLSPPFTSFLYLTQGNNATADPPTTIRMAQIQDSNTTTGWGRPTLLIMEHLPGFIPPEAINAPEDLAWHASELGSLGNESTVSEHALMRTYGTGIVADLWEIISTAGHWHYVPGENDENRFIQRFIERLGVDKSPAARAYAAQVERAEYRMRTGMPRVQGLLEEARASLTQTNIRMIDAGLGEVSDLDFQRPTTVTIEGEKFLTYKELTYTRSLQPNLLDRFAFRSPSPLLRGSLQPTDQIRSYQASQALPGTERAPRIAGACARRLRRRQVCANTKPVVSKTDMAVARQGGVVKTMTIVSATAAHVLNEVVRLAAVAFVIIDFIEGFYLGGAMGMIGIAAASIMPLLMGGPMGVLFGTALAFLFFILPGVFEMLPTPPSILSNLEILQYAFFGDKDHTGNEKCAKEHPGCVASYGPGILALIFKWEFFDAVAFLLWANHGFPITMPDLAKSFDKAISLDRDQNQTAVAGITCGNYIGSHTVPNRWGTNSWSHTNPNQCSHPKFHLNRDLITLPNVNRTAADVYNDIIGGPNGGGSCKIINNADNMVTIPDYGIRIKGLPVAIACGIDATASGEENVNGTLLASSGGNGVVAGPNAIKAPPLPGDSIASTTASAPESAATNLTPTTPVAALSAASSSGFLTLNAPTAAPVGSSPGSLSTNGRTGEGYTPPPPPAPFQNSLTPANAACFTTPQMPNYFCVPNGTYGSQYENTFNFKSRDAHELFLPPDSSVIVHYTIPTLHGEMKSTETFTSNVTLKTKSGFHRTMDKANFFEVMIPAPPSPPVACLFTKPKYMGDVTCVGVGGGNMTAGAGEVSSVTIHGGATVTLYPNEYGDPGSQTFTVSVEDLATVPYGTDDDLKGKVKAVLVEPSSISVSTA